MPKEVLSPPMTFPDGSPAPLSKVVRCGDFLFLSGNLATRSDGSFDDGNITSQTRQVLNNIKDLLAEQSVGLDQIYRATVWLTDVAYFADFNAVYREFFPSEPPARSTVCSALMSPKAKIEIEVSCFLG